MPEKVSAWSGAFCAAVSPAARKARFTIPAKAAAAAATVFIAGYFLAFAGRGVWAYFDPDDMMNLYGWWSEPAWKLARAIVLWFLPAYRPVGGAFYTPLFALFGFNPLPYRVVAFALMFANLGLAYGVARRVAGSREIAALTVLIGCYHSCLFAIYESTGMIYDVLSLTFYFAALLYYLRCRERRLLEWRSAAVFSVLYILALGAKESAVTLPGVIGAYELIHHPPKTVGWLVREARGVWAAAIIVLPFLVGKMFVPSSVLFHHPSYTPTFTKDVFLRMSADYAQQLFHDVVTGEPARVVALWVALLAAAALMRSRTMLFAWAFLFLTPIPVEFLDAHRAGFVLYIPIFGWALYLAALLVRVRDRIPFPRGRAPAAEMAGARVEQVVLFLLVALALIPAHRRVAPDARWVAPRQAEIRTVVDAFGPRYRSFPRGARLLVLDDPLPADFTTLFTMRLWYRDPTLVVDRVRQMGHTADPAEYDYVFRITPDRRLVQLKGLEPVHVEVQNLSRPGARDFYIGEEFRVVVQAAPDQQVANTASQNGAPGVRGIVGRTDGYGAFTVTGKMAAAHAGTWREVWSVGRAQAREITFVVKNP